MNLASLSSASGVAGREKGERKHSRLLTPVAAGGLGWLVGLRTSLWRGRRPGSSRRCGIKTSDGVLIEVEAGESEKCSARSAKAVQKGLEQISTVLGKACGTMKEFWSKDLDGVELDEVQIAFGLSFEIEGDIYIARAKGDASISVTATLKKPA
jgi:hypothetical protein